MFTKICEKLAKKDPKTYGILAQRKETSRNHKFTFHSFRSFAVTMLNRVDYGFGHGVAGHSVYMGQYNRIQIEQKVEYLQKSDEYLAIFTDAKTLSLKDKRIKELEDDAERRKTYYEDQNNKWVSVASLPDSMRGGAVEEAIKNAPYEQTEQEKINQANTNARLKQASRNKVKNYKANIARDPTVGYANEIQAKLGRAPISVVVTRRRRGRWSTSLSQDPAKIIDDYNKKTAVINWAEFKTKISIKKFCTKKCNEQTSKISIQLERSEKNLIKLDARIIKVNELYEEKMNKLQEQVDYYNNNAEKQRLKYIQNMERLQLIQHRTGKGIAI